jgi:hypothetical protein
MIKREKMRVALSQNLLKIGSMVFSIPQYKNFLNIVVFFEFLMPVHRYHTFLVNFGVSHNATFETIATFSSAIAQTE